MKHIVFVVGNYKNGGVPMRSTNLANEFAKAGYHCTILVTKDIAENVFFEHNENVSIISLKEYISEHKNNKAVLKNNKKRKRRIRILKYFRHTTRFFKKLDEKLSEEIRGLRRSESISVFIAKNPDCIYFPFGISYYENVYYGTKGINSDIIYAERNAPEIEFPHDNKKRKHLFNILSKGKGAVLQTNNELAFYEGKLKNAVVINNPVKANLPEPYQGKRRKIVVNFCRVSEQKNLPLMIKAFIDFHKTHPDYTLEIYGNTVEENEENLKAEIIELISSLNSDDFVKILPPRADVHSVIRDCAMFVSSSDFEGLSNSMIEAMAIGLPCVCTDCLGGGAREMITDGENGLLVSMKDANALTQAMCRIADDEELSKKCSENAAKVRETHKVETIAGKWLEMIEKII